eukprot:705243-Rhodomonas_salina.3
MAVMMMMMMAEMMTRTMTMTTKMTTTTMTTTLTTAKVATKATPLGDDDAVGGGQAKQWLLRTSYFKDGLLTHFTASMISGIVVTTIMNPFDVVRPLRRCAVGRLSRFASLGVASGWTAKHHDGGTDQLDASQLDARPRGWSQRLMQKIVDVVEITLGLAGSTGEHAVVQPATRRGAK